MEIATRVRISAASFGSSSSAATASATLRAPGATPAPIRAKAASSAASETVSSPNRDPAPIGRSLQHQRDLEAGRQLAHHVVAGEDELGAPLDHRAVAEGNRPDPPADPVERLQDRHLGAAGPQRVGRRQPGEPGADHDDPPARARSLLDRCHGKSLCSRGVLTRRG